MVGRMGRKGGAFWEVGGMSMCRRDGTWESGSSWSSCSEEWDGVSRHIGKDCWETIKHVRRCESTGIPGSLLWEVEAQPLGAKEATGWFGSGGGVCRKDELEGLGPGR